MSTDTQSTPPGATADPRALPFPQRLKIYLDERFPPVGHTLLIVAFFYSGYLLAEYANPTPEQPLPLLNLRTLVGFFTVLLSFFMLRLFDEFKDYELDLQVHPERVVSQGIITLRELRIMLALDIVASFAINLLMGWKFLAAYAAVFAFALLMRYEFFMREQLIKDIFLYAVSHQVIIPLYCFYIYSFSVFWRGGSFGLPFWLYSGIAIGTCLGFEVARKTWDPDQEREGRDSYSRRFGLKGSAGVALALQMVAGVLAFYLGGYLNFPLYYHVLVMAACGASIAGTLVFWTGGGKAKHLQHYASAFLLLLFIFIIAAVLSTKGVQVMLAW